MQFSVSLKQQIIAVLVIYIISLVGIYVFGSLFGTNLIKKLHKPICFKRCTNVMCKDLYHYRGKGGKFKFADEDVVDEYTKTCLFTAWGLSHTIMYTFLGFFAPDMFWPTFAIGTAFELVEIPQGVHNVIDIALNTIGFFAGRYIRTKSRN